MNYKLCPCQWENGQGECFCGCPALPFTEVYYFSFCNFHIRIFPVWKHERLPRHRNTPVVGNPLQESARPCITPMKLMKKQEMSRKLSDSRNLPRALGKDRKIKFRRNQAKFPEAGHLHCLFSSPSFACLFYCTRGLSLPSISNPTMCARPASSRIYWLIPVLSERV